MAHDPKVHAAVRAAVKQLDTVVLEQERAVDRILGLLELLLPLARDDAARLRFEAIMEACSFQDITGQRVRKVSRLLRFLAEKGELSAPGLGTVDALPGPTKKGLSQEDVDRLLNSGR